MSPLSPHFEMSEQTFRRLSLGLVIFAIILGALGMKANRDRADEGRQAHSALCVYKDSLQRRVTRTEDFLKDNTGPFIAGFPRALFERGLSEDRVDLLNLKANIRDCPQPPKRVALKDHGLSWAPPTVGAVSSRAFGRS